MFDLKYISFFSDGGRICIIDKLDGKETQRVIRFKYSDYKDRQEMLRVITNRRDMLFESCRGVPFVSDRDAHTSPSKNCRTGMVGVTPYVTVKVKSKGNGYYICTGFASKIGSVENRIARTFTFHRDDPTSEFLAYKSAVYDACTMRMMPQPSDSELKMMMFSNPIPWNEIIHEKIARAEKKAAQICPTPTPPKPRDSNSSVIQY